MVFKAHLSFKKKYIEKGKKAKNSLSVFLKSWESNC